MMGPGFFEEALARSILRAGCVIAGALLAAIVLVMALIFLAGFAVRAAWGQDCETGAFDCGHHENHDQYIDWKTPTGGSCCSGQDCRPVRARATDDGWEIYVPEYRRWKLVPREKVNTPDLFKDGRSHVCTGNPSYWGFDELPIYCFTPAQIKG